LDVPELLIRANPLDIFPEMLLNSKHALTGTSSR
jgi:hypothetical protein